MILSKLKRINHELESFVKELEATPEKSDLAFLLKAMKALDVEYKDFCKEMDIDGGDPVGTAYEEGINIEWQTESSWWHDISVVLRKLDI